MQLDFLENSMSRSVRGYLTDADRELAAMTARLDAISPLAVLSRGYSLTMDSEGAPLLDPSKLQIGDRLYTRLSGGTVESTVDSKGEEVENSLDQNDEPGSDEG
jgi:exodeoxyribonuclease VII large subunit